MAFGLSTFPIKIRPVICNGLHRSLPNCVILDSWVFENFILADQPIGKPLIIIIRYCIHQSHLMKDLKLPEKHFFIPDFTLLCCKFDSFTFKFILLYIIVSHFMLILHWSKINLWYSNSFYWKKLKWFLLLLH